MHEPDGPPDAHAADRTEDESHQYEEERVFLDVAQQLAVVVAVGAAFSEHEEEAPADGKVRNEDVQDGDDADQDTAADHGWVPDREIHRVGTSASDQLARSARGTADTVALSRRSRRI